MPKADGVHRTPRKTASKIVSFPKSKRPLPADRPSAIASVERCGLNSSKRTIRPKTNLPRMNNWRPWNSSHGPENQKAPKR
jgi:hypothetical protein